LDALGLVATWRARRGNSENEDELGSGGSLEGNDRSGGKPSGEQALSGESVEVVRRADEAATDLEASGLGSLGFGDHPLATAAAEDARWLRAASRPVDGKDATSQALAQPVSFSPEHSSTTAAALSAASPDFSGGSGSRGSSSQKRSRRRSRSRGKSADGVALSLGLSGAPSLGASSGSDVSEAAEPLANDSGNSNENSSSNSGSNFGSHDSSGSTLVSQRRVGRRKPTSPSPRRRPHATAAAFPSPTACALAAAASAPPAASPSSLQLAAEADKMAAAGLAAAAAAEARLFRAARTAEAAVEKARLEERRLASEADQVNPAPLSSYPTCSAHHNLDSKPSTETPEKSNRNCG
jgi:hypothetical protein